LYRNKKNLIYLLISAFLVVSLAFTYSRASYLALIIAAFAYFPLKRIKVYVVIAFALVAALILLPRPEGEGVKLERVASIGARWEGYKETIVFYRTSPLFGIGFNNMCNARENVFGKRVSQIKSNACSGSDSSLLLVLTTTGVVGLIIFINTIYILSKKIGETKYKKVLVSVSMALFVHSFFANSLFYPWIMGYFGILVAISMNEFKEYK
jgi:O-antigen ligase